MNVPEYRGQRAGRIVRTLRAYETFIPHPLPPDLRYSSGLIRILAGVNRFLGELAGVGRTLPNPYLLVGPAVRREAVQSSRIEGTEADLEDLDIFEAEPREAPARPDVREVHNYVVALRHGFDRLGELSVSLRLVREVHARLMEGVRGHHALPGDLRTTQNWVGRPGCSLQEAPYVPPAPVRGDPSFRGWERARGQIAALALALAPPLGTAPPTAPYPERVCAKVP